MLHLQQGGLYPRCHRGGGKHHPSHTGGFQQCLLHRLQPLQLLRNELAETVRHAGDDRLDPALALHARCPLPQDPTAHRVVHHRNKKQRMALGPLVQEPSQLRRTGCAAKALVYIRCHPCR